MNSKKTTDSTQEDTIDLKDILAAILNKKWLVIIVTILFILGGYIYTKLSTPKFKTNILININQGSGSGADLSSIISNVAPMLSSNNSAAQKQIDIIRSRSILEPVVKKLNLDVVVIPKFFPLVGKKMARDYNKQNYTGMPAPAFLGLSSYSWGGENITINSLSVSSAWQGQKFSIIFNGNGKYTLFSPNGQKLLTGVTGKDYHYKLNPHAYININLAKITGNVNSKFTLIQMHIADAVAALAAKLSIQETDKSSNLLTLSFTGTDPVKITNILDTIGVSAVDMDVVRKSKNAAKLLVFLKKQLPGIRAQLHEAETALNNYRAKSGNISITDETKLVLQKLANYDANLSDLELQRSQMAQKLTVNNPQLKQIDAAIIQVGKQKSALEAEIRKLPESDQIAVNLMREADVQSEVYKNVLGRIQQYEILKAGTIGTLEMIDSASIPYKSINKPASLIIALSAILGLFLSIAWIFIQQYLFKGIEDPDLIEEKFNLEMLGSLHKSKLQSDQVAKFKKGKIKQLKLLSEIDPHDLTIEGLRSLRTNLFFKLPKANNNIIAVSGPVPNIGKSFVSANLAQIISDSNKKVILVDADIRKGDLHESFSCSRTPGFVDLLNGDAKLDEIVKKTRFLNLDFMPTGAHPQRHSELLMRPECKLILDTLSNTYDIVVIDTAPILAVTDATEIFKHAGTRILVLAASRHDDKEIALTLKRFEKAGVSADGFVFNLTQQSHTYYGNKYKYKYKYK